MSSGRCTKAILLEKECVTQRDTLYRLHCEDIASVCRPGQFVELRVAPGFEPFFRRPISIFDANGPCVELMVRTVGRGTRLMTEWPVGMDIDVIGPLGNGFHIAERGRRFLLAGGGIGAAPLHYLARRLRAENKEVSFLFSPRRDQTLLSAFADEVSANVRYIESRAQVEEALLDAISQGKPEQVFACGPEPFMKAVTEVCGRQGVPVQVSMESRMACGVGICLGCVIPICTAGEIQYRKVCCDGPVFDGREVVFHE